MGQIKNIKLHIVTDIKIPVVCHPSYSISTTSTTTKNSQNVSFPFTIPLQSCTQRQPSCTKLLLTIIRWWQCLQTPCLVRVSFSSLSWNSHSSIPVPDISRKSTSARSSGFGSSPSPRPHGTHIHHDQT